MNYKEQLQNPRWQKKRLEIMQRDNFTCQYCTSKDKLLHVHHIKYDKGKLAWEHSNEQLLTLCGDCHKGAHKLSGNPSYVFTWGEEHIESECRAYLLPIGTIIDYKEMKFVIDAILGLPNIPTVFCCEITYKEYLQKN